MKRRNFIATFGAAVASGSAVLGTGAFTSVSAERSVSVEVGRDYEALLKLTPRGDGRRSYDDGGTIGFDIPGPDDDDYPTGSETDPEGLAPDSVYRFGDDAAHDEPGLFAAENQGTQPVELYSTQTAAAGVPEVTMYNVENGDLLTEDSPSEPVGVGEQLLWGLEIDTHGVSVREEEYDLTLIINAVATGSD